MAWIVLSRHTNKESCEVGEYRYDENDECFILEYRSPERSVALLSHTMQWMKNVLECKGYEFEFTQLGSSGFIVKIPKTEITVVGIRRIKREVGSMASWLYSKHPEGEEEPYVSDIPPEPTVDKEYDVEW